MTERGIEEAKRLQQDMSEEKRQSLAEFNEAQTDWTAVCRVCGQHLVGTLAQLREHKHGPEGQ